MKKNRFCLIIFQILFVFLFINSVNAGWNDCAIDWDLFTTYPGYVAEYTYKGEIIRDTESKGTGGDPTHGQANVPPAQTDLASGVTSGTNPGLYATPAFGYYDGGTPYDKNNPSTMNDDYIYFRIRITGNPAHQDEFDQYHWNILLDVDADGYKEYWVDIEGSYASKDYDRLNILYSNDNRQDISNPDAPGVRVEYFRAYYSVDISNCSGKGYSHTRVRPTNDGTGNYWIDIQVPMSAFKDSNGNQVLYPDSPVAFVYSTGASNQDPLQKDWMMDLNFISLADPITFGDIILPNGKPIIEFTDSSMNQVSFYTIGSNIYVYVKDPRANTDNDTIQTIVVTVTNTNTGDDEVMTLYETGPSTGIFTNKSTGTQLITTNSDGIYNNSDNSGSLEVVSGDTIYVSYTNSQSFTVTDSADIIGTCDAYIQFTRANGLPTNEFMLRSDPNTSDRLYVTVFSYSANQQPNVIETIQVTLSGMDSQTLTLTETGPNTGVFRNTGGLQTKISDGTVTPNDNLWEDIDGGVVTATYNYTCGGNPYTKTTTARVFITANGGRVYFTNVGGTEDVSIFGPNDNIYIKVEDSSNCGTGSPKTLTVTVTSSVDSESVTVTETFTGSGVFRNTGNIITITTYDGSAISDDGVLEAINNEDITVTYYDCNDGDNDSSNNNKMDTAKYNAPSLVINEVLFWPSNEEYSGNYEQYPADAICQTEYIQIYNQTPEAVNLNGYYITDGDNFIYYFPNITLNSGKRAYVSIYSSSQNFPNIQDSLGNWYLFSNTSSVFPSDELGDPDDSDPADQVLLFDSSGNIIDYIAWSSTLNLSTDFLGDDSPAVSRRIWQDDAFVNVSGMSQGLSLIRKTDGYDTNTVNDWRLTDKSNFDVCRYIVTRTLITAFDVYNKDGKVLVEWETSSENKTVGFYLLRLNSKTNEYEFVNKNILPSILESHVGGRYGLIDEGANISETNTYKIIEIENTGRQIIYGPFVTDIKNYRQSYLSSLKDGEIRFINGNGFSTYFRLKHEMPEKMRLRLQELNEEAKTYSESLKSRKGKIAKLYIKDRDIYFIDVKEISNLINTSQKDVINSLKRNKISLSNDGNLVSYMPADNNSGIYFYAEGIDSIYTDENVYWLEKKDGKTMEFINDINPSPNEDLIDFVDTMHYEENKFDATSLFKDPNDDYWFWEYIVSGDKENGTKNISFNVSGISDTNYEASLKIDLQGGTNTDHHVSLILNGEKIGEALWYGMNPLSLNMQFNQSLLKEGNNVLSVTGLLDTGAPYSIFYINSFDLKYKKLYKAINNKLICHGNSNQTITVSGFTNSNIHVFNITEPQNVKYVKNTYIDEKDGVYRVSFTSNSTNEIYIILTNDAISRVPKYLTDVASKLKSKSNKVDYLIITIESLADTSKLLTKHRSSQKLKTMIVQLEDILDEFNYGRYTPTAIKEFLKYTYRNWKKAPEFVVIIGNGTYDYKDYLGLGDNLIPPLMVSTPEGLFPSDIPYVDFDDDHIPEMLIGRLSILTNDELKGLVKKIINYEKSKANNFKNNVILVADYPVGDETFPQDSDDISAIVPNFYYKENIYISHPVNESRDLIIDKLNEGMFLFNYIGHAGIDRLSRYSVLTSDDVNILNNVNRLPIMTTMTCVTALYAIPGIDCIGEVFVKKQDVGAIAFWAPTGMSENRFAKQLDIEFVRSLLNAKGKVVLGRVIKDACLSYKNKGGEVFMIDIYNLIGDPALLIRSK